MRTHSFSVYAPVVLRIVLGIIFVVHGYLKLAHMAETVGFFARIGIPLASVAAPAVALLEIIGGIALILGLLSRLFALLLIVIMLSAIFTAKMHSGFVRGWEFELTLAAGLFALVLSGPGAWSLARDKEALLA